MSPEKEQYLLKTYSSLYREFYLPMDKTAMCWGFNCYDGWFKLLDDLSKQIQDYIDLKDKSIWFPGVRRLVRRALYKNGTPTFLIKILPYFIFDWISKITWTLKGEFKVIQVKEKYGTLRYYVEFSDTIIDILIDNAERRSSRICEDCGQEGDYDKEYRKNSVICSDPRGWYFTKCRKCWKVYLKEYDKHAKGV